MTSLAPLLETFFIQRLRQERRVSDHTIAAYRDTFRLLLGFLREQYGKKPSDLTLTELEAQRIVGFLDYLEQHRGNSARTRNARLAAIHSFFRFVALREPAHAALIQRVLAIPNKRFDRAVVTYLADAEVDALLAAPDTRRWLGRRDHALILLMIQTGLRVSEMIRLTLDDVHLGAGPHLRCTGKGRKERCVPLTAQSVAVLRLCLRDPARASSEYLFQSSRRAPLSRDAIEKMLNKHLASACRRCPTLRRKRVSPHVLRHTCAMRLLHAGVDTTVIALWLGHESVETTQIYLHADLSLKEKALARTLPPHTSLRRYHAQDELLAFLEAI